MTRFFLLALALLIVSGSAEAQLRNRRVGRGVTTRPYIYPSRFVYHGNQKITTLPDAPKVTGKEFPDAKSQGKVLDAKNWSCGKRFTDGENRIWYLVHGDPVNKKPEKLAGWEIESKKGDRPLFMTTGGTLFRNAGLDPRGKDE